MKVIKLILVPLILLTGIGLSFSPSLASVLTGSNYKITKYVLSSGGGATASSGYLNQFTIGQPLTAEVSTGSTYNTHTGFMISLEPPEPPDHGASLDMDYTTQNYNDNQVVSTSIEPSATAAVNDEIYIAIVAQNVTNLDTYQVEVTFDNNKLLFMEGYEDSSFIGVTNLLKKNGGTTVGFMAVENILGTINISNSLSGNDEAVAPEGTGIIALLKFKVMQSVPNSQLILGNVQFVNSGGLDQSVTNLTNAGVIANNADSDGDGIDDAWEITYFGDLLTANATSDYDQDGYLDIIEFTYSTDPLVQNDPGGIGYNPKTDNRVLKVNPAINLLLLN